MKTLLVARPWSMGQAAGGIPLRVMVTDINGRAVAGAEVTAGAVRLQDAGHGLYTGDVPAGPLRIVVRKGEQLVAKDVAESAADSNVYVQIPVCMPQPLLTTAELVALLGAGALTGAGFYWKVDGLKLTGEVLFGAAAFTAIHRLSCL